MELKVKTDSNVKATGLNLNLTKGQTTACISVHVTNKDSIHYFYTAFNLFIKVRLSAVFFI